MSEATNALNKTHKLTDACQTVEEIVSQDQAMTSWPCDECENNYPKGFGCHGVDIDCGQYDCNNYEEYKGHLNQR